MLISVLTGNLFAFLDSLGHRVFACHNNNIPSAVFYYIAVLVNLAYKPAVENMRNISLYLPKVGFFLMICHTVSAVSRSTTRNKPLGFDYHILILLEFTQLCRGNSKC